MQSVNRQSTAPLRVPRSNRNHAIAVMTSMKPGFCVPVAAIPLLREDALNGRMRISMEMLETKEILMNPTTARVTAYCVPLLALERFEGSRDQFDRSYMGQPKVEGGAVVPFLETHAFGAHGSNAVYKALGLHGKPTDQVNTAYLEAVNAIWNFRAKNRSKEIVERDRLDATLPPAFWQHSRFAHIVPDFDQAVIDGEIALNVVNDASAAARVFAKHSGGRQGDVLLEMLNVATGTALTAANQTWLRPEAGTATASGQMYELFAELQDLTGSVTVSLSNLELAKKTQAFAKLRTQFEGHDDEWIIDMLMDGLTIPDQAYKQPILLADKTVRFGQAKRYATDSGNLEDSAVSGATSVDIALRMPKLNTGGVIIVQVEVLPEQLWERQRDPFFHSSNTRDANGELADWPAYLRDHLDPEPVDIITNAMIDTDHANPNGTFGYAPTNWKWNASGPKIGGKFLRPTTNTAFDEARQRLWAVEAVDPVLSEDFYVCSGIHTKPFLDEVGDPFELTAMGNCVINGNTQFGGVLIEATNNYDKVLEKAPQERIAKDA